MIFLLVTGSRY